MRYDPYTHRMVQFPASYFDTMALVRHFASDGLYAPFAGYGARWTGYVDDTMTYAEETTDYLQSLDAARINIVMKDFEDGAYLADQYMDCEKVSDQIEFNNTVLISNMLYDLVRLIHINHFHFNEESEVRLFYGDVNTLINAKYAPLAVSLSVQVQRVGTVGRAASTNKVVITINMRDIAKWTEVELYIVDA